MSASTGTVRLHRVFKSSPELVYRAFLDPDAMCRWLPPIGYVGKMHEFDGQSGGTYRMSFTAFATGHSQSFGGIFLELVPHQRIRIADRFDDPNLPGEMTKTITLREVRCGVELEIVHEGIPAVIPPEMCYLGWQDSLMQLQNLVEPGYSNNE